MVKIETQTQYYYYSQFPGVEVSASAWIEDMKTFGE